MKTDKTLIIGANGQIGRLLIHQMQQLNMPCLAMVRSAEQEATFHQLGIETVLADLEENLPVAAFEQCNQVVFTAGSGGHTGPDKTILVDLWGACRAIDMAKQHHIQQFVMVSTRNAGQPEQGAPSLKYYNICKHFADEYLMTSGVPYTILRPGRLTNETDSGLITTTRPVSPDEQLIPRQTVAACIIESLRQTETINQIIELYQGEMPIPQAFMRAVSDGQG